MNAINCYDENEQASTRHNFATPATKFWAAPLYHLLNADNQTCKSGRSSRSCCSLASSSSTDLPSIAHSLSCILRANDSSSVEYEYIRQINCTAQNTKYLLLMLINPIFCTTERWSKPRKQVWTLSSLLHLFFSQSQRQGPQAPFQLLALHELAPRDFDSVKSQCRRYWVSKLQIEERNILTSNKSGCKSVWDSKVTYTGPVA